MARIRSIHPGLFSDEVFVALSAQAQVFWIGLLCDADDQGVFEWKPVSLKMRILPAAVSDVSSLLDELEAHKLIRRYESGGATFGAIRNFCRYQRPKWPRAAHPVTAEIRSFTAADGKAERGAMSFSNDPTAADRQRRKRDRDRNDEGDTEDMSRISRDDDGTVTARERRGEERSNSVAKATGAAAPAEPSAVTALPVDWRERLFRQGLASVSEMTGKPVGPARSLIGRWLRVASDDARKVLRTIEDAQEQNAADPVAWIEAALKARPAQRSDSLQFTMARG
ncbi:hypothetical protein [Bosea sp. 47.2.35]|uniref:hypothetical protein n=1 Tax=Bosea sp. 47.2.35 TaxID=2969304 RepID=UPI00214FB921|nr:hypothetical protein [Bosea sp. 47.2.35]MCR4524709.1 hypothetical protein [Bosea sp. 47.2.35]